MTTRGLSLPGQLTKADDAHAALAQTTLAAAERRIGRGRFLIWKDAAFFGALLRAALGALGEQRVGRAAVVGGEQDDGVVAQPLLFELGDDAPDLNVKLA